ncbi:hypothetical protein LTR66_015832 [Elasticomyces elasticus]|nr:hypothetical protein LTR66_015832 [Elasticomyces elasticus]
MPSPIRLAILECDTPVPKVQAKYGGYGDVFTALLTAGAKAEGYAELEAVLDISICNICDDPNAYPKIENVDAVLLTGSKHDSFRDDQWIKKLVDFTAYIIDQKRIKLIGVCFGHQIIARSMGVKVGRNADGWEVAVNDVQLSARGKELFGLSALRHSVRLSRKHGVAWLFAGLLNTGHVPERSDLDHTRPPEPTPPPLPISQNTRTPSINQPNNMRRPYLEPQQSSTYLQSQTQRPNPSMTPQTSYNNAQYRPQSSTTQPYSNLNTQQSYVPQANSYTASHPGSYNTTSNYARPMTATQNTSYNTYSGNALAATHRTSETYVLSDVANAQIPKDVRDQFPQDDHGRVLFFTQPPTPNDHVISGGSSTEQGRPLQHSAHYQEASTAKKRKLEYTSAKVMDFTKDNGTTTNGEASNNVPTDVQLTQYVQNIATRTQNLLASQLDQSFYQTKQKASADRMWQEQIEADVRRGEERLAKDRESDRLAAVRRAELKSISSKYDSTRNRFGKGGYLQDWQNNMWTGVYLDDRDPRLP